MSWLDAVLLNMLAAFVVMSVVAAVAPSLRNRGSWRGIGLAWLAAFLTAVVIAFTNSDWWGLSCNGIRLLRMGVTQVGAQNVGPPCSSTNAMAPFLVALPSLIGIAVLFAWILRRIHPAADAGRSVVVLIGLAIGVIALGQINENWAFLATIVIAVLAIVWPMTRKEPVEVRTGPLPPWQT